MNFVSAAGRSDVDVIGAKEIETRGCLVMSVTSEISLLAQIVLSLFQVTKRNTSRFKSLRLNKF
jgi:hypothetical protein